MVKVFQQGDGSVVLTGFQKGIGELEAGDFGAVHVLPLRPLDAAGRERECRDQYERTTDHGQGTILDGSTNHAKSN